MPRAYNDAKWGLGEPWASKLSDFLAANYKGQAKEVVREALDEHINRRLGNEPELRKRYEAFRKKREDEEAEHKT